MYVREQFCKLGESKKKTTNSKRQTSKAETQEVAFKNNKLTDLFEHSLKSETGYCVPSTPCGSLRILFWES